MKIRALAIPVLLLTACEHPSEDPTTVQTRLRNSPPPTCTAELQKACPAPEVKECPPGQEPVLDYSADCCAHFSCLPMCQSAEKKACSMAPAPVCPPGTKLWIGTAVEDCCPAYRCEPDGTQCDAATGCACKATSTLCTLSIPYCGPEVSAVVVGQTSDCCPIYQCPCDGRFTDPMNAKLCGCTFPNCKDGERIVCDGKDSCGGPCRCEPAVGTCAADSECPSDSRCDLSNCLLPPSPRVAPRPECDVAKCGPALLLANTLCKDGQTMAGPTGKCIQNADGTCGWEIIECPSTPACYGICVPNVQSGCKSDSDCPSDQMCTVECSAWVCTKSDASTACTCPASDPSCTCDAAGNCAGKTCTGRCMPKSPACSIDKPALCPPKPACDSNVEPEAVDIDTTTCCPVYKCPICVPKIEPATARACPMINCKCPIQVGTDPLTCCPIYECAPSEAATAKCL